MKGKLFLQKIMCFGTRKNLLESFRTDRPEQIVKPKQSVQGGKLFTPGHYLSFRIKAIVFGRQKI